MLCRHCGKRIACRTSDLCTPCYNVAEIRQKYRHLAKSSDHRGVGTAGSRMPSRPTRALPGTPEKVAVLEQRAARNEALWHPKDPTWYGKLGEINLIDE
jgi:hypothetical protein